MSLSVLGVSFPLAEVGGDAVGGAEQVLATLDRRLVASGHRSLVLAPPGSRVSGILLPGPSLPAVLDDPAVARVYEQLRVELQRICRTGAVDVVHLHGVDFARYLPPAANRGDVPVVVTLHLPPSFYPPGALAAVDDRVHLVCVSESQRRACPPDARIEAVIPNGVALELFEDLRARKRGFALALGRICPEKGLHLAIDAARRAGVPLLIGGRVYPYPAHQRYFDEEIAPRLGPGVRFLGPVGLARKRRLLAAARCLLVPSLVDETSSLVAMEALACGTPVVAFARGALTEIVEPTVTGFLVADVPGMAGAIAAAGALSPARCRQAAAARFSASAMACGYHALYERLSSRRKPSRTRPVLDELQGREAVEALAAEWSDLWDRCPSATPFQRPEWLLPWCARLSPATVPRALTLRRAGRLAGMLPYQTWPDGDRRVASLLGAGISDYLDALVAPEHAALDARELLAALVEAARCDLVDLQELRAASPLLAAPAPRCARDEAVPQSVCPVLSAGAAHASLWDAIPKSVRDKSGRYRRRLEREGDVAVDEAPAGGTDAAMDTLFRLHGAEWRARGGAGVLDTLALRAFHREVAREMSRAGLLHLLTLRVGGEAVGVVYGFRARAQLWMYLGGFDPEWDRFSVGTVTIAAALSWASGRGARECDFLRGGEPYKYRWGAVDRASFRRRLAPYQSTAGNGREGRANR